MALITFNLSSELEVVAICFIDVALLVQEIPIASKRLFDYAGLGLWDEECAVHEAFVLSSSKMLYSQISVGRYASHLSKVWLTVTAWTHWQYRESTTSSTGMVHFHFLFGWVNDGFFLPLFLNKKQVTEQGESKLKKSENINEC